MNIFELEDYGILRKLHKDIFTAEHLSTKKEHVLKFVTILKLNQINDAYTDAFAHARVVPHPNVVEIYGRYLGFGNETMSCDLRPRFDVALEKMGRNLKEENCARQEQRSPYSVLIW